MKIIMDRTMATLVVSSLLAIVLTIIYSVVTMRNNEFVEIISLILCFPLVWPFVKVSKKSKEN